MAEYKTPGTKEFKKISYLKELMMDIDPVVRKKALLLYNQIMKTENDGIIEELEKYLEQKEKVIRQAERRQLKEERIAEEKGLKPEKKPPIIDRDMEQELSTLRFKLKYYSELKDIEVDLRLKKIKINI